MATLNVLYGFASDAKGFTAHPAASATLSWSASDSGSLQSSVTGKNHSSQASSWTLATTWQGLGVPAGATITGVTAASMQSQCTAFTTGGSSRSSGAATLADGATTITLSAQRSFTATDASPTTTNGTDATGLSLAAADSITLTIPNVLSTGNSASAAMTLLQDELAFTITYTPSSNAALSDTLDAATVAAAGAVTVAATLSGSLATATLAAAGTTTVAAGLNRTLANAIPAASGAVIVAAASARTLGAATLSATGTSGNPVNAALTATLGNASLSAAGTSASHTITPIGVGTATLYPRQTTAGSGIDTLVDPDDSNPPIIFEPPAALSGGDLEVWLLASGGANWGGCQIWVSSDGSTYAMAGTIYRGGRQGVLTATLPSHSDPDTTDTLSVNLSESQGQMLSGTLADADNFVTLCYCDGELVSYQTATLTASYTYDLTYLRRGVYGTPIGDHTTGASFARLGPNDPSLFRYRYPASFAGQTISVKLPAFNIFGQALQDLSGLTPTSYTLTGAGAVPAPAYVSGAWAGSPGAGQVIERYIFATFTTFPAGLGGSYGTAGTAAAAAASFSIAKNGAGVGTMDFAAGATSATFSMASPTGFASGDVLTIVAPGSPDATLANLAWTLAGTL